MLMARTCFISVVIPTSRNLNLFNGRVQRATYYWAMLLQATGGHLEDVKCYWYLLLYKFVRGVATLCSLREHSKYRLVIIPQPQGDDVEIELCGPCVSLEVLGVYSCPAGVGKKQLSKMVEKGARPGQVKCGGAHFHQVTSGSVSPISPFRPLALGCVR
jgi:hypothetical protein